MQGHTNIKATLVLMHSLQYMGKSKMYLQCIFKMNAPAVQRCSSIQCLGTWQNSIRLLLDQHNCTNDSVLSQFKAVQFQTQS